MNIRKVVAWASISGMLCCGMARAAEDSALKDQKDRLSYSLGVDMGHSLKSLQIGVSPALVLKGIRDVLTNETLLMSNEEIQAELAAMQKELQARYRDQMNALGEKNKIDGEQFLAENGKKDGVVTLPSGLEYKVLKEGSGNSPTDADTVTVQYRGTLIDGTEFDSSYSRGQPAKFSLKSVIAGWTEALKLMHEGSKWQLFVPSNLAYGERSAGTKIGPNATLIFEVELLSVNQ